MGTYPSSQHQSILVGPEKSGKTLFLYNLVFRGQKEDLTDKCKPSVSYNYELIELNEEKQRKLGIFDLPGNDLYRKYWKHFYKNIPLKGIIFMATTKMTESNDVYDQPLDDDEYKKLSQVDHLVLARKQLHAIVNEPECHNCFVLVIVNDRQDDDKVHDAVDFGEEEEKTPEEKEFAEKLRFDDIPQQDKDMIIINGKFMHQKIHEMDKIIHTLDDMLNKKIEEQEKEKEKKEKKKQKK